MTTETPRKQLEALLSHRILVLDGAMGTMIQAEKLAEADFRGERFRDHPTDLRGDNEALVLTRPDVIEKIHAAFLEAGADIIETNTFSANRFKLAAHGCEDLVRQINVHALRLAREATGPHRTLVAGSLGPLGVRIEPLNLDEHEQPLWLVMENVASVQAPSEVQRSRNFA